MNTQTKLALAIGSALAVALVVVLVVVSGGSDDRAPARADTPEESSRLFRDDARVIGEPGRTDVTFVEFLDFECEACGAAYPVIEALRDQYAGRVTFIARYFPLPGHANAMPAALAVESAARQGKFEEMYQRMYETQREWGEQQVPMDDRFRGYAEELGLDMAQYDRDVASPEVAERVQRDVDDGIALGVASTPTFYVNGAPLQPQTVEDFTEALDQALAE